MTARFTETQKEEKDNPTVAINGREAFLEEKKLTTWGNTAKTISKLTKT